jgi:putrescine transport system permease protein
MLATHKNKTEKALIIGLMPILMFENNKSESVVDPGPVKKLAITKSSSDRVNASIHPVTIDRIMIGNFI